ncbi:MAG: hypothetical protein ACTSPQ_13435 [Candidatus Helarchaeota archaeon]
MKINKQQKVFSLILILILSILLNILLILELNQKIMSLYLNPNNSNLNDNEMIIQNPITIHKNQDVYNYTMKVGVPFKWLDATTGTQLFLADDGYSAQTLPFSFKFYDQNFSIIYLSANGYLSFIDNAPNDFTENGIPSSDPYDQYLIAVFWDDLRPASGGGGGTIYVKSFTNPSCWVAQWQDIHHFPGGTVVGTFQVILFENGDIKFQYDYISYTAGGYDTGLNYGVNTSFFNSYNGLTPSTDNLAILFSHNVYPPELNNGSVSPSSGNSNDNYNFTVLYTDLDNRPPSYIYCWINDTYHSMEPINSSDTNYTDGVWYQFITPLPPGSYQYHFAAFDGNYYARYPTSGELTGPVVSFIDSSPPKIKVFQVAPGIGHPSTRFKFVLNYSDPDNNPPDNINVIIDNSPYTMIQSDPNDLNYIDGTLFYVYKKLDFGMHSYYYEASSGSNLVNSSIFIGPIMWNLKEFSLKSSNNLHTFSVSITNISLIEKIYLRIKYPDSTFKEIIIFYQDANNNTPALPSKTWDSSNSGTGKFMVDLIIIDISGNMIVYQNIKTIQNYPSTDFIFPIIWTLAILAAAFTFGYIYTNKYASKIKLKRKSIKSTKKRKILTTPEITPIKQISIPPTLILPKIYTEKSLSSSTFLEACPYCKSKLSKQTIEKLKNGYRVYCPNTSCRTLLTH